MGMICKLFGHQLPEYMEAHGRGFDGVGTHHYQLRAKCERCGEYQWPGKFHSKSDIELPNSNRVFAKLYTELVDPKALRFLVTDNEKRWAHAPFGSVLKIAPSHNVKNVGYAHLYKRGIMMLDNLTQLGVEATPLSILNISSHDVLLARVDENIVKSKNGSVPYVQVFQLQHIPNNFYDHIID